MEPTPVRRAEAVRVPRPSRKLARAQAEWRQELAGRLGVEQRSLLRGLVWLALAVLLVSGVRAGWSRMFVAHWWRQW